MGGTVYGEGLRVKVYGGGDRCEGIWGGDGRVGGINVWMKRVFWGEGCGDEMRISNDLGCMCSRMGVKIYRVYWGVDGRENIGCNGLSVKEY